MPISELAGAAGGAVVEVSLDSASGVSGGLDLNEDVESLARNPAHDNVDWLHVIVENARVPAEEGKHLVSTDLERNLRQPVSIYINPGFLGQNLHW